ncbi:Penicillin-binding protein 2D [Acaryochloris thomasi RCC1774]|uniref:Penicillin-binding protein 2D n=1 Tax=Acaryochloris thomasi RCC1774 TaxID=1764569 RepID=A0A2W1JL45_9CYAN|nr:transglycosylase domain-containing protein [Acaryochloris thomasi]PZD74088.1 Penicillin-binding protein 2D [Acaryochloris thomasi RCC1774]
MTPDPPPSRTILGNVTQVVKTIFAPANVTKLVLKSNARVPKLLIRVGEDQPKEHKLIGDRYVIGRSSQGCDIVIRNPIVSQVHASLQRDQKRSNRFVFLDESSTNGTFHRKQRVKQYWLHHKDQLTLGPPALAEAVQITFIDPPPWYIRGLRYALYGVTGMIALVTAVVAFEWQKFEVTPLPVVNQGPIVVLARDQTPLTPQRTSAHGELKSLSEFSPYVVDALLASEDSRYYWHLGVDPIGTLRAFLTNVSGGSQQGGSGITQQVARSLFRGYVGAENSIARKYREAMVALKLETFYSKDLVLLTYLNKVYLGVNANGFEDAARFYFDKSAGDVSISEAATLVGILPAPNAFNPVQDYDAALFYRNRVITRMAAQGRITQEEGNRARRSRIEISPKAKKALQSNRAPYYYSYVFDELKTLLGPDLAQEGNFIVETGLDPKIQEEAMLSLQQAVSTAGSQFRFSQGAIVTLDYRTGEILALVGGVDYAKSQFNRATQAKRQPGSTFKLFGYAAALDRGISPSKAYACSPLTYQGFTYKGCRSGGASVNMYTGMALSENVVALRVAQDAGLNRVIQTARDLGVESKLDPVPAVVLGQNESTVLEMSRAYAVVANGGLKATPLAIRKVLDAGDCEDAQDIQTCRVIFNRGQESAEQVLEPRIARTMTRMMQGVISSGTGRSASLGLGEAGKTGTTDKGRDLWFIGYVPRRSLLTGIWLGNDDNQPTSGSSGQAATLWGQYMRKIVN